MNIGQKVTAMKRDLAKIVSICNEQGDYRMANQAQSALQSVGSFSQVLGQGEDAEKTAKIDVPG